MRTRMNSKAKHYSATQPLHEINIEVARDERYANIGNNVCIREDTQRVDTTLQSRQKSSYADKGKGLLTYAYEKELASRSYDFIYPLRWPNLSKSPSSTPFLMKVK
ncbi:hypothetical protein RHSIM_Rhsim08G0143000 [Rhododendron simsii]|uniref:Uncharacterized protein n=1 Tax=Rhododendron simsii TaxID=118357 RepID=A0A834GI17_RHOSS|nr:hypothetical protein RHSIM_Rhsim08G0143000 [Rhododendron simsii]